MKRTLSIIAVIIVAFASTAHAADCQVALAKIFRNEGGFQKLRCDSGNWTGGKVGKGRLVGTKYGLCAATYPHEDIRNLTLAKASRYYERDFWGQLRLSGFKSQGLATTILDTGVNCGPGAAAILFARERNILSGKGLDAPVDPVITQDDVAWANAYTKPKTQRVLFYLVFQALRSERYVAIAKHDPNKRQFLDDWLIRTWRD
jgi:lysozyme family protein